MKKKEVSPGQSPSPERLIIESITISPLAWWFSFCKTLIPPLGRLSYYLSPPLTRLERRDQIPGASFMVKDGQSKILNPDHITY